MFNLARAASYFFAMAFLASCSTSGSAPPLSGAPIAGSTTTSPNLLTDYVTIHFHNKTSHTLVARTYWTYPILPHWIKAAEKCVDPNKDWSSEIGFTYPHGQVQVRVLKFDDNFCSGKTARVGIIDFDHIQLYNERATITSEVSFVQTKEDYFELCGRQTDPNIEKRKCDRLIHLHNPPLK
jgi:hypothetical protein